MVALVLWLRCLQHESPLADITAAHTSSKRQGVPLPGYSAAVLSAEVGTFAALRGVPECLMRHS
jgi:hypothetical protein